MRDGRLLRGEFQPSLPQKAFQERSDLIFEYLFRVPGDDEVVGLCRTPGYAAPTGLSALLELMRVFGVRHNWAGCLSVLMGRSVDQPFWREAIKRWMVVELSVVLVKP